MKKNLVVLLLILVAASLTFTSCDLFCAENLTSISDADLVGTWALDISTPTAYQRWEYKSDHTYRMYTEVNPSVKSGTWSLSGFTLTTDEDITITMTCDKETMTMTFPGDDGAGTYTYTKYSAK
jgi:hypothetical protein